VWDGRVCFFIYSNFDGVLGLVWSGTSTVACFKQGFFLCF